MQVLSLVGSLSLRQRWAPWGQEAVGGQAEATIQVGSWLQADIPFLRAQRCMGSRQSLLDYSLTQLYRAAERYRG